MDYEKGYVYSLMDNGGPTDVREAYFKEAVDEMMRASMKRGFPVCFLPRVITRGLPELLRCRKAGLA